MKTCTTCKTSKPLEDFYRDKNNPDGREYSCKICRQKAQKQSRSKYPRKDQREQNLKYSYNISIKEYDALLKSQNGVCVICGNINRNNRPLFVDHDHLTGEIRGLLCSHCNSSLGYMRDNPVLLRRAADYLEGR